MKNKKGEICNNVVRSSMNNIDKISPIEKKMNSKDKR